VRVFPGLNLLSRPRALDIEGLPADVDADLDAEPGDEMSAQPVTELVADLPIVEAQVEGIAELDEDRQPFAPKPALGDDEDEGPQPGNELTPGASVGGRRRRPTAPERAPRAAGRRRRPRSPRPPRSPPSRPRLAPADGPPALAAASNAGHYCGGLPRNRPT
jgi:hypothetical protein